jgi:hypothetical protein
MMILPELIVPRALSLVFIEGPRVDELPLDRS